MATDETKDRILDAAESLFGESGVDGVSLRQITARAGVNLAAVNYHYGSKEGLVEAVFLRRTRELNRERLRLLDEAEAEARARGLAAAPLEVLLRALLAPPLLFARDPSKGMVAVVRLMSERNAADGGRLRQVIDKDVGHLRRFLAPLERALPHLPAEEVAWRLMFALGVQHVMVTDARRIESLSGGACDLEDVEAIIDRVVAFVAAGFIAPAAPARPQPAAGTSILPPQPAKEYAPS